ncbi:MAG TPA: hypothetical protein VF202_03590 [Trueperaceae bacterium]
MSGAEGKPARAAPERGATDIAGQGRAGAARPPAEQEAIAASSGGPPFLARLRGSAALEVSGPDAAAFLHGQLANDVTGLRPGGTNRSLLLNHKGHALAEAQVLRLEERRLVLVVDDDRVEQVAESLERHVVFDEVELRRVPAAAVTLQGSAAADILAAAAGARGAAGAPGEGAFASVKLAGAAALVYAVRRSSAGGFDALALGPGDASALEAALVSAGAVPVGPGGLDAARVAAGVSSAGREGGEGVLPQEAGLERFVSFRKGCYLGQEIMARVAARGAVRRGLATLELAGEPAGRDVEAGGRVVGRLGTVARLPDGSLRALAVLRHDLTEGTAVSAGGAGAVVVVGPVRRMPS